MRIVNGMLRDPIKGQVPPNDQKIYVYTITHVASGHEDSFVFTSEDLGNASKSKYC